MSTAPLATALTCLRTESEWRSDGQLLESYADDLTFSLPRGHEGPPKLGALMGVVRRIVEEEGFAVHPEKTRLARSGARQKVTGLVVNGDGKPRVPRKLRREMRAALHDLKRGRPLKVGETLARLTGYAAYINMSDPLLGAKMLATLNRFVPVPSANGEKAE